MSLADARSNAHDCRKLLESGIDPRRAQRKTRARLGEVRALPSATAAPSVYGANAAAASGGKESGIPIPAPDDNTSIHFLIYEYVTHFVPTSWSVPDEVIRILKKDALPHWGTRDARTISSREVIDRLDEIVARGSPVMANRTATIFGQMFRYGIHRSIVASSPVQLLFAPGGKEKACTRALKQTEIIAFLHGLPAVCTEPKKVHILRILIGSAIRIGSLAKAEWTEFDLDAKEWSVPAEHDKERRPHIVPLTDFLVTEFQALKVLSSGSRFVLPSMNGSKPSSAKLITRTVARLQERFQAIGVAYFTAHDLRRSCKTLLSMLGVRKNISERILNHAMPEIEGTYDVYKYLRESAPHCESSSNTFGSWNLGQTVSLRQSKL